jgi:signal transduction histidine kinase
MKDPFQELVYAVSHDLAAPVRQVQGFSKLLLERLSSGADPDRTLVLLGHLDTAAHRLGAMLDGILELSRVGSADLDIKSLSLHGVVRQAELHARVSRGERKTVEMTTEQPDVLADEQLLRKALEALIDNAWTYAGEATVQTESSDGRVRVWVRDKGPGIDPRQHDRIFRPLDRGDPPEGTEGAGVGLALARRAMERMGGSAGVDSAPGAGAAFWLDLPAA